MATLDITVTADALDANDPNAVMDLTFNYAGTTLQNGTVIYYGALLTDSDTPANEEEVLFPLTVTTATNIPASSQFAYTPATTLVGTVTASLGKVYYTA